MLLSSKIIQSAPYGRFDLLFALFQSSLVVISLHEKEKSADIHTALTGKYALPAQMTTMSWNVEVPKRHLSIFTTADGSIN
jgi:hypothetical protein